MPQPSRRSTDRRLKRLFQKLPPAWKELLAKAGTFRPGEVIQSEEDLMRLILLYCGVDAGLRLSAGICTLLGAELSDEAVRKRLRKQGEFLELLIQVELKAKGVSSVLKGRRILALDATAVQGPGAKGTQYRLHLCMDLLRLDFVDLQVSDAGKGESLRNFVLRAGDLVVGDRGYSSVSGILDTVLNQKVDVLLRWKLQSNLYDPQDLDKAIDLPAQLQDMAPGQKRTMAVAVGYSKKSSIKDRRFVSGYLHIYRMDPEQSKLAKRNTIKQKNRKQRNVKIATLFLSQFVIVFTNISPDVLSADDALELYRCRWQIELAFKRLKGLLRLDKLRSFKDGELARTYLLGKILYALLIDEQLRSRFGQGWEQLDSERQSSLWRPTQIVQYEVDAAILQVHLWEDDAFAACFAVLQERHRKKRRLQSLPQNLLVHVPQLKSLKAG